MRACHALRCAHTFIFLHEHPSVTKGGGTYFHLGGGGGDKDKKGHNNVKKGTDGAHADNITNVLMKHHCRQGFFLHAERIFF